MRCSGTRTTHPGSKLKRFVNKLSTLAPDRNPFGHKTDQVRGHVHTSKGVVEVQTGTDTDTTGPLGYKALRPVQLLILELPQVHPTQGLVAPNSGATPGIITEYHRHRNGHNGPSSFARQTSQHGSRPLQRPKARRISTQYTIKELDIRSFVLATHRIHPNLLPDYQTAPVWLGQPG